MLIEYNHRKYSFSARIYTFLNNVDVLRTIFCLWSTFSIDIDCLRQNYWTMFQVIVSITYIELSLQG